MSKPRPHKPYSQMNLEELREATKEFDREFVMDTFRPLTPQQRAQWNRMRPKRGRPQVGQGAAIVSVSIERGLLSRADRLAKRKKTSRAQLIARGLEHVLAQEERGAEKAARKPRRKAA